MRQYKVTLKFKSQREIPKEIINHLEAELDRALESLVDCHEEQWHYYGGGIKTTWRKYGKKKSKKKNK